jgi:hypothetical protein
VKNYKNLLKNENKDVKLKIKQQNEKVIKQIDIPKN